MTTPKQPSDAATLYTDGASSGNPGPAGASYVILDEAGRTIAEKAIALGVTTVGVAEYKALIAGLSEALNLGVTRLSAISDSEFMCKQLQGHYQVRTPAIQPLYLRAKELSGKFEYFNICHAGREHNERADALAKEGARMSARR